MLKASHAPSPQIAPRLDHARRCRAGGQLLFTVAVIQPHRLDAVREALAKAGRAGHDSQRGARLRSAEGASGGLPGAEYEIEYVPKIKLEVAVPADVTQRVVDTIRDAAHTGNVGDGKIFVLALEAAQRVRTGETGENAL
jgi:nitrogen regulatory protein PII